MDHRPYENWLLNDERLSPVQERDLNIHLRSCPQCAALQRANLALRAAPVVGPSPGFALRFQARQQAVRAAQRQRSVFGLFFLGLAGVGILMYILAPLLIATSFDPTQVLMAWVSLLNYSVASMQALGMALVVITRVLIAATPASAWVMAFALWAAVGALWVVSYRRSLRRAYSAARA